MTNYKNYRRQAVEFSPGINVFTGLNGMGKTNLLDALYYCCMTKSYFTPQDRFTVREGEEFFRLSAEFEKAGKRHTIAVKVRPGQIKEFALDRVPYEQMSQHIGVMPVVIVAPQDTELILGGSSERRRFIDATLSQLEPVYLQALMEYHAMLTQRNAHLKAVREGQKPDYHLLETYASRMNKPAAIIKKQREAGVSALEELVSDIYARVAETGECVGMQYIDGLEGESMEDVCNRNLQRDCLMGRTVDGTHRDDIRFLINAKAVKKYASQGQLKTFLIALNLGKYHLLKNALGIKPCIFLDDSFGKLDQQRTMHLLHILSGPDFGQIFITDTSAEKIKALLQQGDLDARILYIDDGNVADVEDFRPAPIS